MIVTYGQSLGSNYDDSIHKRMSGRHERRTQYAGINTKATQRFGGLCSPYQALQLLVGCHDYTMHPDTMLVSGMTMHAMCISLQCGIHWNFRVAMH